MNVKKFASIVLFTDEMIEDVQSGDLNVLVDSGVRTAINDVIDAHAIGKDSGVDIVGVFDSELTATTNTVEYDGTKADGLELAISRRDGQARGERLRQRRLRWACCSASASARSCATPAARTTRRRGSTTAAAIRCTGIAPFYSTNLNNLADTAGATKVLGRRRAPAEHARPDPQGRVAVDVDRGDRPRRHRPTASCSRRT